MQRTLPRVPPASTLIVSLLLAVLLVFPVRPALALEPTAIGNTAAYAKPPAPSLPPAGGSYIDPTFGTKIIRLTDATIGANAMVPYSYWPVFNATTTRLWVVVDASGQIGFGVAKLWNFDKATDTPTLVGNLFTSIVFNLEGTIWSRSDPDVLYGLSGNNLYSMRITGPTTRQYTLLKNFTGLIQGTGPFQMMMGGDDRYFAFYTSTRAVVWDRVLNTIYQYDITQGSAANGFDEVHLTRDGTRLIISANPGPALEWDFVANTTKSFQLIIAHHDVLDGKVIGPAYPEVSGDYAIWDLNSPFPMTNSQIFQFDTSSWPWPDKHTSCQNYADAVSPQACFFSSYVEVNPAGNWKAYLDEIIQVWTDGSGRWRRLAHHRSEVWNSTNSYRSMPKGSVDPSGTYVAFISNWDGSMVGSDTRHDVFILKVPPLSGIPPAVVISTPGGGATLSGSVAVAASATSAGGIQAMELFLDGTRVATTTSASLSYAWSTTNSSNGGHTLSAYASDPTGLVGTSSPVTVTVANDATPPVVSVVSPYSGQSVSGMVTVTVSASDNVGVTRIEYLLDGQVIAVFSPPVSTLMWDSTTVSNGSHSLGARAYDAAGNLGSSTPVSVTAANGSSTDITAPTVLISVSSAHKGVTVSASASDNVALSSLTLSLNGQMVVTTACSGTSCTLSRILKWRSLKSGTNSITATAADSAGNVGVSLPYVIYK